MIKFLISPDGHDDLFVSLRPCTEFTNDVHEAMQFTEYDHAEQWLVKSPEMASLTCYKIRQMII